MSAEILINRMVKNIELALKRKLAQGTGEVAHPSKRFYRSRAHSNPLNDSHFAVPSGPEDLKWSRLFPPTPKIPLVAPEAPPSTSAETEYNTCTENPDRSLVRFVDVGCGFGGLLIRLAPLYPNTRILGFELRDKVTEYVKERILALQHEQPQTFSNIACARTNAMKFLPNYFHKGQLQKLFFLFPDPHFKATNHRRRIIQTPLLAEYAYVLGVGGLLYTISDVQELSEWMQSKLDGHPLFEKVSDAELANDPAAALLEEGTEEGQKVARNSGSVWRAVYRRI